MRRWKIHNMELKKVFWDVKLKCQSMVAAFQIKGCSNTKAWNIQLRPWRRNLTFDYQSRSIPIIENVNNNIIPKCWWQRNVSDFIMVTVKCWRQNHYVDDFYNVKKSVISISKMSPTSVTDNGMGHKVVYCKRLQNHWIQFSCQFVISF